MKTTEKDPRFQVLGPIPDICCMVTSAMLGSFKKSQATRNEFFAHIERGDILV